MNPFAWVSVSTIAEAAAVAGTTVADAMREPDGGPGAAAIFKAGGIDVLDLMKERLLTPPKLVGLRQIPGMDRISREPDGGMRIGALATLAALAADPDLAASYPALVTALRGSASPQIRNVATLGGNLLQRPRCWYFRAREQHCLRKGGSHCFAHSGDNRYHAIFGNQRCAIVHPSTAATALVALGAEVELLGPGGAPRRLKLEDFFVSPQQDVERENVLQPREVLTAIRLPPLPRGVRMAHLKQGEKDSFDWPLADVAVVLDMASDASCRDASIVLGAAAPVPYRATQAARALLGRRIDTPAAEQAGRAAVAGATPLAMNSYKLPLFETLVRRAVLLAAGS